MAFVNLMDIVYPVGSVYMTTTTVSPASSIGGTWTEVNERFIKGTPSGSYAALSTGGSETVQPYVQFRYAGHNRQIASVEGGDDVFIQGYDYGAGESGVNGKGNWVKYNRYESNVEINVNNGVSANNGYDKGCVYYLYFRTAAANNNPPYITMHIWYRTA